MWNVVDACSRGTSHTATGKPCQDAVLVHHFESLSGPSVAIAIADGAGSAERADIGAQAVVEFLVESAAAFSGDFKQIKKEDVSVWFDDASRRLSEQVAVSANCPPEALASTAMLAVLWETGAVFAHVGDGAWVSQKGEEYVVVTWPFSGEYANQISDIFGCR
jgi:serine/threonine protein phosphatase PrpC